MSLKEMLEKNLKVRKNGLVIGPDIGWAGPKPANTRAEKIDQIKTEFIDDRALLVVGAKASDFAEYPKIEADISVQDLIKHIEHIESVKQKLKKKMLLVITGLDKVSAEEQAKFIPLLKDRQIMASKLPDTVQIVMPVADADAVSNETKSLIFKLKV